VSRYQKGKTNLDFTETRDSEWQWHQLGHMQVCTSLQIHNHASTQPQAGCPSCHPTNSIKALKAYIGIKPRTKQSYPKNMKQSLELATLHLFPFTLHLFLGKNEAYAPKPIDKSTVYYYYYC